MGPEGWVALALYCALYWPAATLLLRRLKRRGLPFALTAPVTFAAFEFIRGNFLTGFPFFFLAHTQYRCLPIVQIADITGVYGITFLIALVNGCLAESLSSTERGTAGVRAGICPASSPDLLRGRGGARGGDARVRLEPDARAPTGAGAEGGARPGERAAGPQGHAVARGSASKCCSATSSSPRRRSASTWRW